MSALSIEQYNETQKKSAQRVLDSLDRLDTLTGARFKDHRKHERLLFRGQFFLYIAGAAMSSHGRACDINVRVWGRAVSASGLSFIFPGELLASRIALGLRMDGIPDQWFQAEIVRAKKVPDESFWEYGAKFRGRIDPPAGFTG